MAGVENRRDNEKGRGMSSGAGLQSDTRAVVAGS